MKVIQQVEEKPKFVPIITLETAEEYFQLLASIGENTNELTKHGLKSLGVEHLFGSGKDYMGELYVGLNEFKEQVKETL
jgi:hypothetical protein